MYYIVTCKNDISNSSCIFFPPSFAECLLPTCSFFNNGDHHEWNLKLFVTIMCRNDELRLTMNWIGCLLKYGLCKKSLRKNESLTSWTLLALFFSRSALISTDLEKKWAKSVQLVRVSFFRSDFVQNHTLGCTLYILRNLQEQVRKQMTWIRQG